MQRMTRRPTVATGEQRAILASRLLMIVLAFMLLPAFAAAPSDRSAPPRNPQLASLQVEIWPEYDRPAALVILRGAIAAEASLPADVTLRLAASTGGPSAMAYSAAAGANLLNLEYQRSDASDFITLRFKVPERYFHVEFYDPVSTATPERSYTYVWPGDLGMNQLRVILQEPAAASNFSALPKLGATASGQDGLRYHSGELGAQPAGKQLPIKVTYTKTDARTSEQILQPKTPDLKQAAGAGSSAAGSSGEVTKGVLVFVIALSLLVGIGTAVMWWRGRGRTPAAGAGGAGSCSKCGAARATGDKFCSKCGARLK